MSETDGQRAIERAILEHPPDMEGRNAMLTGWILVAEWSDEEGEGWLTKLGNHGSPSWRHDGLLFHGLNKFDEADGGDE